jgi:hypothetical protein
VGITAAGELQPQLFSAVRSAGETLVGRTPPAEVWVVGSCHGLPDGPVRGPYFAVSSKETEV